MSRNKIETALKVCLSLIANAVGEAQKITRSSACCLETGDIERAFNIALNIEPFLFDADKLLVAATTLRRSLPKD